MQFADQPVNVVDDVLVDHRSVDHSESIDHFSQLSKAV